MPIWGWIVIGIVVAVAAAALVAALAARQRRARTEELHERFGPEYDRAVRASDDRNEAEAELSQRLERRRRLEIRPLRPEAGVRYRHSWHEIQAQFVDAPEAAVASADAVIVAVMRERGYPVEDFEQRAADVSVDHPLVVENYRAAHVIAGRSARNEARTEDLRQAMQHYRALFDELLDTTSDEPVTRERAAVDEAGRTASARGGERANH